MKSETSHTLLRQLKFAINSEEHTPAEWQGILSQMQEIGNRANMRLQMTTGVFLEVVPDEVKETLIEPDKEDNDE